MEFPDVMVDLETTGTDPSHAAIIQIAAVRFNYATMQIGPAFEVCLHVPYGRFWDEDTRDWWLRDKADLLARIQSRAIDPQTAMSAFQQFMMSTAGLTGCRFWAKPSHFDWPLLASYTKQFDVELGFHYRSAVDLNSFCRGLADDPSAESLDKEVEFEGEVHNAIDDVLNQIKVAFMAKHLIAARRAVA